MIESTRQHDIQVSIEVVRRIGQALWMSIDTPVRREELSWAQSLLGAEGSIELYDELLRCGALVGPEKLLSAEGLARFLCDLVPDNAARSTMPHLVWTLPSVMAGQDLEDAYLRAAVDVIESAHHSLWVVSPFLEARGIGRLLESFLNALGRGVHIRIIAHGVGSVADRASAALEQLRREAALLHGKLSVNVVRADAGLLVHSKLIVADEVTAILGSANLTDRGLTANFEAGVVVSGSTAAEIVRMLERLMQSGLIEQAFSS